MLEGDGVGVVRFNQDAQVLQPIVQLGNGGLSDINRSNTKDILNGTGLDPNGQTSIGDGIFEGRGILNSTSTPFAVKSLVVLTDGVENRSRMIADVASDINEFTYAVGLGQPQNISVPALQTISGNNGGYLLVTGAIGTDNRFLLQKYFLQILAGISNAEIVLDPEGQLIPGRMERVPFQLTAGDAGVDVILLTPYTEDRRFPGADARAGRSSSPGARCPSRGCASSCPRASATTGSRCRCRRSWWIASTAGAPGTPCSPSGGLASNAATRETAVDHNDPSRHARAGPAGGHDAPHAGRGGPAGQRARGRAVRWPAQRWLNLAAHVGHGEAQRTLALQPRRPCVLEHLAASARRADELRAGGARSVCRRRLAQSGIPLAHRAQVWAEVTAADGSATTVDDGRRRRRSVRRAVRHHQAGRVPVPHPRERHHDER